MRIYGGKSFRESLCLRGFQNSPQQDASRSLVGQDDFDEVLENQKSVENWRKGDPSKVVKTWFSGVHIVLICAK